MGDKFTRADAYAFTIPELEQSLKLNPSPWPNIKALARVGGDQRSRNT